VQACFKSGQRTRCVRHTPAVQKDFEHHLLRNLAEHQRKIVKILAAKNIRQAANHRHQRGRNQQVTQQYYYKRMALRPSLQLA
jgi:hypothetical protein